MADETTQGVHDFTLGWWRSLPQVYRHADRAQGYRLEDAWTGLNRDPRFFTGFDSWDRHNMSQKAWEASVGFTRSFRVDPNVPVHIRSWHAPQVKHADGTVDSLLSATRVRHTVRNHTGKIIADDQSGAGTSGFDRILDGGSVYTTSDNDYDGGTPGEPGETVVPVPPEPVDGRIIHHTLLTPDRFGIIHVTIQVSVDITDLNLNDRFTPVSYSARKWASTNLVLAKGQPGIQTDQGGGFKIGDGLTPWAALGFSEVSLPKTLVGTHTGPFNFMEAVHVGYEDATFAQLPDFSSYLMASAYPLLRYMDGIGHQAGYLSDMANDMHSGAWTDPVTAPDSTLKFLAAVLGVSPRYVSRLTAGQLREHLVSLVTNDSPAPGSRRHIAVTAQQWLTGSKQVSVVPAHTVSNFYTPAERSLLERVGYRERIRRLWVQGTPPVPEVEYRWAGIARKSTSERVVNGTVRHRNYLRNPGLTSSLSWVSSPSWSWTVEPNRRNTGPGAARVVRNGEYGDFAAEPVVIGTKKSWRGSAWVYSETATTASAALFAYANPAADGSQVLSGETKRGVKVTVPAGVWTELPVSGTFAGTTTRISLAVHNNPAHGDYTPSVLYVGDPMLAPSTEWAGVYFDGDAIDSVVDDVWVGPNPRVPDVYYRWTGAAGASISERVEARPGTDAVTHRNHVLNPGVSSTGNLETYRWTWVRDSTVGRTTKGSAKVTRAGEGSLRTLWFPTGGGTKTWRASVWVYSEQTTKTRLVLNTRSVVRPTGKTVEAAERRDGPITTIPAKTWTRLTISAPLTPDTASIRLAVHNAPGEVYPHTTLWVDDFMAAPTEHYAESYFDGSTPHSGTYHTWMTTSPGFSAHTWETTDDGFGHAWKAREYPTPAITEPGADPVPTTDQLITAVLGERADSDRTRVHTLLIRVRADEVPGNDLGAFARFLNDSGVIPAGHVIEPEEATQSWDDHEKGMGETWSTVEAVSPTWNAHDSAGVSLEYVEDTAVAPADPTPGTDPTPTPDPEPEPGPEAPPETEEGDTP